MAAGGPKGRFPKNLQGAVGRGPGRIAAGPGHTIGRLVVAQAQYAAATRMVRDSLDQENTETCSSWSTLQEKYFKQARACANDLGLTITSRCRLIVPQGGGQAEQENPLLELISGGAERRA